MTEANGAVTPDAFKTAFARSSPLIAREWPGVDADALRQTDGDLERVIELVATTTKHTKTLVRSYIAEIHGVATAPERRATTPLHALDTQLASLLERLEQHTADIATEVRSQLLPQAKDKVKSNLLVSLLVTLGLGFLFGLMYAVKGARRER